MTKFVELRTCANEHDIVLSVLCLHFIHHQLGELVVYVCPHHDGTPPYGVHWVVHGWVSPGESDDIIGKVLGGVETSKCLTGTLRITTRWQVNFRKSALISDRKKNSSCGNSQCQGEGRAPSLGRAPTGSWVHLCGRRDPGKPSWCLPCCTYTLLSLWRCYCGRK